MKTATRLLALFFVAATSMFAACDRDTETLTNTTWEGHYAGTFVDDESGEHEAQTILTIEFTTGTDGVTRIQYNVDGAPEENYDDTHLFSYTYAAPNGTLTLLGDDHVCTFTIEGYTMTFTIEPGRTYTLHRTADPAQ